MNIVLFEPYELNEALRPEDPRARHLTGVLGVRPGDRFDAGVIDGPMGKATMLGIDASGIELEFHLDIDPPLLYPVTLLVGLPRPQTARDILRESCSLGIERIVFASADRGERSYAESRLWTSGEYRRLLIKGAETAFTTRIPQVLRPGSVTDALAALPSGTVGAALDNYEARLPLNALLRSGGLSGSVALAVGSERGWSAGEREALAAAGLPLVSIGPRVLRTETACIVGLALVLAALGRL